MWSLKELIELGELSGLLDSERFKKAILACKINPSLIKPIGDILAGNAWLEGNLVEKNPFFPGPEPDETEGEIDLGEVMNG
jgi:hypothetical protein